MKRIFSLICILIALSGSSGCSGIGQVEPSVVRLSPDGSTPAVEMARSTSGLVVVWSNIPTGSRSRHSLISQKGTFAGAIAVKDSVECSHHTLMGGRLP